MSFVGNTAQILSSRSEDGGQTWSAPVEVTELRSHGVDGMRTGQLISAAIDPKRGGLFVTWPDERFTPGVDQIVLATSWDGIGWSAPIRVSDGPDDAPSFTPAVAVNGQGHFGIAYSTFRNDPQRRFLADQYLVTTNSRGRLLGASRVSTHSTTSATPRSREASSSATTRAWCRPEDIQAGRGGTYETRGSETASSRTS